MPYSPLRSRFPFKILLGRADISKELYYLFVIQAAVRIFTTVMLHFQCSASSIKLPTQEHEPFDLCFMIQNKLKWNGNFTQFSIDYCPTFHYPLNFGDNNLLPGKLLAQCCLLSQCARKSCC